ncbi:succinate--CoA ligase beta chain [Hanseniaspora osmophila]
MLRNTLFKQPTRIFKRSLSIHEYRSAELLRKYGIGTPYGLFASTPQQAILVADELLSRIAVNDASHSAAEKPQLVLKAQALTGGRGKGHFDTGLKSGIHFISSAQEAGDLSSQMLGHQLITKQTGDQGKYVSAVYLVNKCDVLHESYLSMLIDRSTKKYLIVCSPKGGMNIEEVAKTEPNMIFKYYLEPMEELTKEKAKEIAGNLGFTEDAIDEAGQTIVKLYKIFKEKDSSLIEINPLAQVKPFGGKSGLSNKVMCMDAKFGFDDNAEFRQKELFEWRDLTQEDADEVVAKKSDLNFIKLNGNIGCLVNGAGLAMATMDVIKLYGGSPANFLDCGGGATPETIETAFKLILSNPKIKGIFVNIFGGIVRCDYVAEGLVRATKNLKVDVPIVVRLQGTNLKEGKDIIEKSGLKIYSFDELDPAAKEVVSLTKE